ncbi:DUF6879 family protein [Streptomyces sp. NPDC054854]
MPTVLGLHRPGRDVRRRPARARHGYDSDRRGARYRAFMRGIDPRSEPGNPWNVNVREKASRGARFSRVRIVDDPPTDGQRFLLASAAGITAAGEGIRGLARAEAAQLEHRPPDPGRLLLAPRRGPGPDGSVRRRGPAPRP